MKAKPDPKVAEIRRRIDHPIVDADAHQLETVPVLLDYIREVGGSAMPERFLAFLRHQRRTFEMSWEERYDTRTSMPVWWPIPTENTLDRATTQLPRLMYERMDELGLDFSIVYPGIGLQIVTLPGLADDELRQVCTRAFNRYYAEMFRGFADRLTPVGLVTMNTPQEACDTLEDAVRCGLKAVVIAGDVLRPVPQIAREHPELAHLVWYQDCFGIDSPYDYDPFWAKCVELGVAPTSHSGPIGWGTRRSVSRHQYNQLGGFAEGGEALLKALWFGGVTRRFPTLNVGFLEGGVAWACSTYTRMIDHWSKRNAEAIRSLDPARLDQALFAKLIDEYGHDKIRAYRDPLVENSLWAPSPDQLDDWRDCRGLERRGARGAVRAALLLRLRGRRPHERARVRQEAQPVRRAAARDDRLRHRPLRRRRHARGGRGVVGARRGRPDQRSRLLRHRIHATRCACTAG